MPETASLGLPLLVAEQGQKHVTHNEALRLIDALVRTRVVDRDLTDPPGSPDEGAIYIPASGATGDWAAWDLNLARYIDGAWEKIVPKVGWLVYIIDEDAFLKFDGAPSYWVEFSSGAGGGGTLAVDDEGTEVASAATRLNFTGAGVVATDAGSGVVDVTISGGGGSGTGDMLAAVYDPNTVEGDAFDMANMVEATDAKVMSAAERTKLAGIEAGAEVNDVASVNGQTGTVVLDPDDLDDTATANKFTTASDISKLAGIETGATADQSDAEIETAYNNQVSVVSQAEAEAGTATTVRRWTAERVAQAIAALASGGGDMFASVYDPNAIAGDAFDMANMVEAADAKVMSAAERTKLAGVEAGAEVNDVASVNGQTGTVVLDPDDLDDTATANKFTTASDISKLAGIETGATADQTGAEIAAAIDITGATEAGSFASGDKLLAYIDGVGNRQIDYDDLPAGGGGGGIAGDGVTDIVALTQSAYDALTPDSQTLYIITG